MRKVFLDDLPRTRKGVDWLNCVGCELRFVYNDVSGKLKILDYSKQTERLKIQWKDISFSIKKSNFMYCKIGKMIGYTPQKLRTYKFKEGELLKDQNNGPLKILEQTLIEIHHRGVKRKIKGYSCECETCHHNYIVSESNLLKSRGCGVCAGKKVVKGINDLRTTHPEIASLLLRSEDGQKYNYGSNHSTDWKCSDCSFIIKNKSIYMVVSNGLFCPRCSDTASYPNKYVFSFLEQVCKNKNIEFETEKIFEWSNKRRYDFYIPSLKCIIEVHGEQHYTNSFSSYDGARTLKEERLNDNYKVDIAESNGIVKYVTIDARESDMSYLKHSLTNSILSKIFDLSIVDWYECERKALSNTAKIVSNLWRIHKDIHMIKSTTKMSGGVVRKYLKKASTLGWCDYDPQDELRKGRTKSRKGRRIICLTTNKEFDSVKDASIYYNLSHGNIISCCKGVRLSTGKLSSTREPLRWEYR